MYDDPRMTQGQSEFLQGIVSAEAYCCETRFPVGVNQAWLIIIHWGAGHDTWVSLQHHLRLLQLSYS